MEEYPYNRDSFIVLNKTKLKPGVLFLFDYDIEEEFYVLWKLDL